MFTDSSQEGKIPGGGGGGGGLQGGTYVQLAIYKSLVS